MKTVIISYERISPAVLVSRVEKAFACFCKWVDIDEDYFKLTVIGACDMAELEDVLAEYV